MERWTTSYEAWRHGGWYTDLIFSTRHPFHCERAECGNELTFDDIQAGDGLCSSCEEAERA